MKHLTVQEIITFVSFNELTSEMLKLSSKVNGHIRSCDKCLEMVNAFQSVYDEFCKFSNIGDFENEIYRILDDKQVHNIKAEKVKELLKDFEEDDIEYFEYEL